MSSNIIGIAVTRRHRIAAILAALFVTLACLVVWPQSSRQAAVITPFLPMFATAVFLTEGITAFLLWTQYCIAGRPYLAALGGAYAFSSVAVTAQLFVFPGIFSPTGLFNAGSQSAVWIWVFWHGGFPLLILAALGIESWFNRPIPDFNRKHVVGTGILIAATSLSAFVCFIAIRESGWLPSLVSGGSYKQLAANPVAWFVAAANVVALGTLIARSRLRTLLDLWLAIALFASLADVTLTLNAGARYSIGWYAARMASLGASSAVLGMLIFEINHLYRDLNAAHQQLQESSARDGLTGIFNRAYFNDRYPRAVANAVAMNQPVSILIIDVDYFKQYNDTFGHQVGDTCLQQIARRLAMTLRRETDFVARYGGEEFAVVLPGCDLDTAADIAELLREGVAALELPAPFGIDGHVTVSIGLATSGPQQRRMPDDLLAEADSGLYRAKRFGRNCVAGAADVEPLEEKSAEAREPAMSAQSRTLAA